jgi:hypothetical protein
MIDTLEDHSKKLPDRPKSHNEERLEDKIVSSSDCQNVAYAIASKAIDVLFQFDISRLNGAQGVQGYGYYCKAINPQGNSFPDYPSVEIILS